MKKEKIIAFKVTTFGFSNFNPTNTLSFLKKSVCEKMYLKELKQL